MKRTAIAIAAAAFAFAACAATPTEALRERLLSGERNCVFAAILRGDWRNFPENNRSSILSAIERGADIVEMTSAAPGSVGGIPIVMDTEPTGLHQRIFNPSDAEKRTKQGRDNGRRGVGAVAAICGKY